MTVGIPVYNGARTIGRALDSLLAQSFTDFELIISDNASTDGTGDICQAYAARDKRVRYVRQPTNLGAGLNFRFVLVEARTPYFMWAAADDLWAPSFIERQLAVLEADPGIVLSQSRVLFTVDGRPTNLSTGTFALPHDEEHNVAAYLTNPADNSRYYGLFRTAALQSVFPSRNFFALDWAVAAATLRFGRHHEIPDILMIRDTSDTVAYERGLQRDHRFWLWRIFPMLYMTIWLLAGRRVPVTSAVLYRLAKLNLYMHLRFGMYRWNRAAELYLSNNSARHSLRILLGPWVGWLCAPGLGRRLAAAKRRIRQGVIGAAYVPWRILPLTLAQRQAFKRVVLNAAFRLGYGRAPQQERVEVEEAAASGATLPSMPDLPVADWKMPRHAADQPACLSVVVAPTEGDGVLGMLALVDSIASAQGDLPIEVVVVDNGCTDISGVAFRFLPGFTYRRFDRPVPFGVAANAASRAASAEALVFVESTLRLDADFLRQCRASLAPRTLVGAQLRSWDGFLDAAGGIADAGGLRGYGAGRRTEEPAYLFARAVDYCPGAFAILRTTLSELGEFSAEYASFEISALDLATRLQSAGGQALYWPAAIVSDWSAAARRRKDARIPVDAHALSAEWERFAVCNAALLRRRAEAARAGQRPHDRSRRHRLLFVDADTPRPDQSAGALLALNLIRMLGELAFRVTFVPESNMAFAEGYTDSLRALGVDVVHFPYCASVNDILETRGDEFDVVVLCRAYIADRYIDRVRKLAPQARIIFNTIDLHFVREMREAELLNDARMIAEAEASRSSELASIAKADATIVVSTHEAAIVRAAVPSARVHVVPLLFEMPERLEAGGPDGRQDIMFVGTYQHPPNRDAAIYFAREIWPLVRERLPQARFLVVGSNLTPDVQALAGDGVEVLGFVEDLDAVLATCRVTVAPLRFGAGLKGKVASSLLAGVPVVASSIAVEGTPLRDGVDVVIADAPAAFADAVVRVYEDPVLWRQLAVAGFDFVRREYSIAANVPRLRGVLEDAGMSLQGRPAADRASIVA
ncbi:glycosyltransferase [Limobrevibacterium gyesilva]|uniref:Glycosyltransferase n=1 Tax=Limobrevibacterium gyesilva TaxID=2991712 RepID=A0AA41YKL8_9PROT|nr:glycosyltransferase [Limobrevibacterium gyesilva]